jgi:hypothetical protein
MIFTERRLQAVRSRLQLNGTVFSPLRELLESGRGRTARIPHQLIG